MGEDNSRLLSPLRRNKYFSGKLLTARDFNLESFYNSKKIQILNRLINGTGIVCGLDLEDNKVVKKGNRWYVKISEGLAIAENGKEIIVSEKMENPIIPRPLDPDVFFNQEENVGSLIGLYISHESLEQNEITSPAVEEVGCEEKCEYNEYKETFRLFFDRLPDSQASKIIEYEKLTETNDETEQLDANQIASNYYSNFLKQTSSNGEKNSVLLAVLQQGTEQNSLEVTGSTKQHKKILANNMMLFNILTSHILSSENPHKIKPENIGAIKNINNVESSIDGSINLISNSFDIINKPDTSEIKIENKQTVESGKILLKLASVKEMIFGPVSLMKNELKYPPAVLLGKVDKAGDIPNETVQFMQDYDILENAETPTIKFKVVNITKNHFSIHVVNDSEVKQDLALRYWAIPVSDSEVNPEIELSPSSSLEKSIRVDPLFDENDTIEFEIDDKALQDSVTDITVNVSLQSKDDVVQQISAKYSSVTKKFEGKIDLTSIQLIPGEILTLSYQSGRDNIQATTRIAPKIIINEISSSEEITKKVTIRNENQKISLKILDYNLGNKTPRVKWSIDKLGESGIIRNFAGRNGTFELEQTIAILTSIDNPYALSNSRLELSYDFGIKTISVSIPVKIPNFKAEGNFQGNNNILISIWDTFLRDERKISATFALIDNKGKRYPSVERILSRERAGWFKTVGGPEEFLTEEYKSIGRKTKWKALEILYNYEKLSKTWTFTIKR